MRAEQRRYDLDDEVDRRRSDVASTVSRLFFHCRNDVETDVGTTSKLTSKRCRHRRRNDIETDVEITSKPMSLRRYFCLRIYVIIDLTVSLIHNVI